MKVLYLIDTLEGYGAEKSIVQIAMRMKEVTPVFVHLYKGERLKPDLINSGIKVYSLNIKSNDGFRRATQLLTPIVEEEQPYFIHTTLFRAEMVGRRLKKIYPNIILVGSLVSNSYGSERYRNLSLLSKLKLFSTQIKDRMSSKEVDYFICNSKAIINSNKKALGIDSNKIKVIPRGRKFAEFSRETDKKLKLDLSLGKKTVWLNVGRLIKSKGQLDIIKAFKNLNEKNSESVLLIAGEGPMREELEKEINLLHLKNQVFLLGYRDDIPAFLSIANFFIFASYFEGLPGALIEAIVAKKACIASNIPENKECFPENNGAFFFPPGNIAALTTAMEKALVYNEWEKNIESSYDYAEENFNICKVGKRYETFYKYILKALKEEV